jgi:hypothetical protein
VTGGGLKFAKIISDMPRRHVKSLPLALARVSPRYLQVARGRYG